MSSFLFSADPIGCEQTFTETSFESISESSSFLSLSFSFSLSKDLFFLSPPLTRPMREMLLGSDNEDEEDKEKEKEKEKKKFSKKMGGAS